MHRISLFILNFVIILILSSCTGSTDNQGGQILDQLLKTKMIRFSEVLENPGKFQLRILYTQIDRDQENHPQFTSHYFGLNSEHYFYPASTVKLPVAVLALEKLNEINISGINKFTQLRIDSAFSSQTSVVQDSTAKDLKPSLAQYIRKVFLVSDNDAYNRLYEFCGQKYINQRLRDKGFTDSWIIRRLSVPMTPEENAATNPVSFLEAGKVLYQKPLEINTAPPIIKLPGVKKGKGYYSEGKLITDPIDFSHSNYISVHNLQNIIKTLIFPESTAENQRFQLSKDDYTFLYTYMSMLPGESEISAYQDTSKYRDSYGKFFIFGDSKEPIPTHIRIFNKVGQAYGYLIDNAYIIDLHKQVEFLLTAVIQVNENQIYNDDTYEYDQLGFPFLARLGQVIYNYELKRKRKHIPGLSRFKLDYQGVE